MEIIIVEMTSTATIAIALFGIVFCLMQTEYSRVSRSFAAFLVVVVVNNFPVAFSRIIETLPSNYVQPADFIIGLTSNLCLAPLLWIYVFTLTSTTQRLPTHLYRHFLLPSLALLVGLFIAVASPDLWPVIFSDKNEPTSTGALAIVAVAALLQIVTYPQIVTYLVLIIRRLMRYRLLLRDVYASTEEHELRWIYVIGSLGILFWLAHVLILLVAFDLEQPGMPPIFIIVASLAGLAMVAATTFWGLRQRPPLVPDRIDEQTLSISVDQSSEELSEKYEKSALSVEVSTRIARKLRAAMEIDQLHRNPNLSLWALARHIGASPNYISQTLNEVIGESFFDFVNGYRIAEAKNLLLKTNDSVLTITYDVGFNARSSFYNAFKRLTGQTPTNYRQKMSQREGMDDIE